MADSSVDIIDQRPGVIEPKRSSLHARLRVGIAVAFSAFLLAGCIASAFPYAVLEEAAQPEDELPAELPAYAGDGADLETARFVGEHDDSSLWLMRGAEITDICILAYRDDTAWVLGCGLASGPVGIGGMAGEFTVVPDGTPAPEGTTQVSENVYTHG
ncbi:hypothetical protein [Microbacterium sp.]|jgi:hypothetical protein|uniref:hypothetical protein n=1 Tax=Microbacterium sp. TaxID=51671 RepID=UPI0037C9D120